jgi:hypothetical protein
MPDFERTRYYSARPRRVPPEFCTDDLLEECSVLAALTLYRIISQADDQGRMPGAPKYVRSLCFSMRPEVSVTKVTDAIDQLVRAGFLIRYDYQGRVLLQVDRWHDLQGKWGRRAYPSRYPAPPGWTSDWVSVKPGEADDPEVRAPSTQDARDLHAPITVTTPVPLAFTRPGLGKEARGSSGLTPIGDLLDTAGRRRLTDEEALELGASIANRNRSDEGPLQ